MSRRCGRRCRHLLVAHCVAGVLRLHRRTRRRADTILLNGKIVALRRGAGAGAGGARRQDRGARPLRRHPRAGRARHPRHRSRRPHRHPRPDRFPHPRHPRRADLHDRGALDRRAHARRGARPHPRRGAEPRRRARGWSSPAAGPSGSSPKAAARPRPRSPPPRPDHHVYVQLLYSRVLLIARRRRGARHRQRPGARRRGSPSRRDADGKPTGWLTGDNRTISDLFDLLPRPSFAQKVAGTRAFFRALNGARPHRRDRSRRLQHADPGLPAAVPGLARPRADACASRYSLCAPRRGHELEDLQATDRGPADGLRRRLAALQRHRRERHLGHVQQRHADARRRSEQLARGAALGGVARADRDVPLAQRPLGASSARRAGARQPRDAGRAAALVDRASQRRLAGQPQAHEGDGRRLADAERVLFPRRGVPRPARRGGRAARAADRERAASWGCRSAAAPTRTG